MRSVARVGESSARRTSSLGGALCLPLLLLLVFALAWPLADLVARLTTADGIQALMAVLRAGRYRNALINSLELSIAASISAVVLSVAPAWTLARIPFRGKALLRTLILLPMTFSGILIGFLMVLMLGRAGFVPHMLDLITGHPFAAGSAYELGGLFVAYLYFEIPRAVMTLEPAFRGFRTDVLEAARTLGAGPAKRFVLVVLPMVMPHLRSAVSVTFAASMGSFGVALILARRFTVASLEVYTELTGFLNDAVAGALCLVLAALSLIVVRLLSREAP